MGLNLSIPVGSGTPLLSFCGASSSAAMFVSISSRFSLTSSTIGALMRFAVSPAFFYLFQIYAASIDALKVFVSSSVLNLNVKFSSCAPSSMSERSIAISLKALLLSYTVWILHNGSS